MKLNALTVDIAKVMDYPNKREELYVFDFTQGYQPDRVRDKRWGIGRYNEKRAGMYVAPQYKSERNVHMGIDIWGEAGEPVYTFYDGEVLYIRDNNRPGDYGPTIVIRYDIGDMVFFALYGHLSRASLQRISAGQHVKKGQKIAETGTEEENGGWVPHLHFQLSITDPGEADMPGVVAEEDREQALEQYPDPRLVLGDLY